MRHRTALPFLDAFLKPTKHILMAYSFIIMYVNPAKFKKKGAGFEPTTAIRIHVIQCGEYGRSNMDKYPHTTELSPFHYSVCNFCEKKKNRVELNHVPPPE